MTSETAPPKFKRTRKLVDPRFQMGLACAVSMMMLGAGAVYMLGAKLLQSERVASSLEPQTLRIVTMVAEVGFFLGVVALIHMVVVRVTLGVVGPALVVERALKSMNRRDFSSRLSLREGDYLEPVALAALQLSDSMESDRETLGAALLVLRSRGASEAARDAALEKIEGVCRSHAPTVSAEGVDAEGQELAGDVESPKAA